MYDIVTIKYDQYYKLIRCLEKEGDDDLSWNFDDLVTIKIGFEMNYKEIKELIKAQDIWSVL